MMSTTIKLTLYVVAGLMLLTYFMVTMGPLAKDHVGSKAFHGADFSNIQGTNDNVIQACDREADGFDVVGVMEVNGNRAVAVTNGVGTCETTRKSANYYIHYTYEQGRAGVGATSKHPG